MTPIVPRVAVFSIKSETAFKTSHPYDWFAKNFEIHFFKNNVNLNTLIKGRFNLIIAVGCKLLWKNLLNTFIPVIFFDNTINGDIVYDYFVQRSLEDFSPDVSIFTPAHNSFEKFLRAYKSVINQSYSNWEWIILDDSPDNKNFEYINNIVKKDYRIKLFKSNYQDGFVGSVKRQAASLCNGKYLLELDHDDELHHLALEYIVSAFKKYPDSKFCYSNSAEVFENGGNVRYGDNFGMRFGLHYDFKYKGRHIVGADVPINASTIRHIVGVPNHFRCWEKNFYFSIFRHNNKLSIVDDYEILLRTFLKTKMVHIQEVLYIQYMNDKGNNTQEPRRAEIQRLVDHVQKYYDKQLHDRILQLGGEDWLWDYNTESSNIYKIPPRERNTLAYVY